MTSSWLVWKGMLLVGGRLGGGKLDTYKGFSYMAGLRHSRIFIDTE
jgi:hypothetical protein